MLPLAFRKREQLRVDLHYELLSQEVVNQPTMMNLRKREHFQPTRKSGQTQTHPFTTGTMLLLFSFVAAIMLPIDAAHLSSFAHFDTTACCAKYASSTGTTLAFCPISEYPVRQATTVRLPFKVDTDENGEIIDPVEQAKNKLRSAAFFVAVKLYSAVLPKLLEEEEKGGQTGKAQETLDQINTLMETPSTKEATKKRGLKEELPTEKEPELMLRAPSKKKQKSAAASTSSSSNQGNEKPKVTEKLKGASEKEKHRASSQITEKPNITEKPAGVHTPTPKKEELKVVPKKEEPKTDDVVASKISEPVAGKEPAVEAPKKRVEEILVSRPKPVAVSDDGIESYSVKIPECISTGFGQDLPVIAEDIPPLRNPIVETSKTYPKDEEKVKAEPKREGNTEAKAVITPPVKDTKDAITSTNEEKPDKEEKKNEEMPSITPPSLREEKKDNEQKAVIIPPPPNEEKVDEPKDVIVPPPPKEETSDVELKNTIVPPPPKEDKKDDEPKDTIVPPAPKEDKKDDEPKNAIVPPPPKEDKKDDEAKNSMVPTPPKEESDDNEPKNVIVPPAPKGNKKDDEPKNGIVPPPPKEEEKNDKPQDAIVPPAPKDDKKDDEPKNVIVPSPPKEELKKEPATQKTADKPNSVVVTPPPKEENKADLKSTTTTEASASDEPKKETVSATPSKPSQGKTTSSELNGTSSNTIEAPSTGIASSEPNKLSKEALDAAAERYRTLPLDERAAAIVRDLGLVQSSPDPDDPNYDHSKDDEISPDNIYKDKKRP